MATTGLGTPYVESSDLVSAYPAASQSLAESIDDRVVNVFASSAARSTALPTPSEGMVSYLQDTDALEKYDGSSWIGVGGKILQIVRATDTTARSTTSTTAVDITGHSVTITPTRSTSAIICLFHFEADVNRGATAITSSSFSIADSSNNTISGGGTQVIYVENIVRSIFGVTLIGYATPATTSATTYKLRANAGGSTTLTIRANSLTSQMYAIEVAP